MGLKIFFGVVLLEQKIGGENKNALLERSMLNDLSKTVF